MLKQIEHGDLLRITDGIILHQVNCVGVVGGLAGALARKYPAAFTEYFEVCQGTNSLGTYLLSRATPYLYIGHIFGQLKPGPNTDLAAVDKALASFAGMKFRTGTPLYAPFQMGCGLGGGNWADYSALLEKHLPHCTIMKL